MPQKRNPDAAELVRAKAGRIIGALDGLLIVMKGLPLAYQKDMQEDKEGAIRGASAPCRSSIAAMTGMVARYASPNAERMSGRWRGLLHGDRPGRLAGARRGLPFREAHHITGRIVAAAEAAGVPLRPVAAGRDAAIEPRITKDVFGVLTVERSVASRKSYGGTAPANVRGQAKRWLKRLVKGTDSCHAAAALGVILLCSAALGRVCRMCGWGWGYGVRRQQDRDCAAWSGARRLGLAGCGRKGPRSAAIGRMAGRRCAAPAATADPA